MHEEVQEKLLVSLEFDANNDPRGIDLFIDRAKRMGGEVTEIALTRSIEGMEAVPPLI